jgi:Zn-dependent protease with chaperone function
MRVIRFAWPLVFLIPLAPFAGRFCNLVPTDAIYHSLVFLHERLPLIIGILVVASVTVTLTKLARVRSRIQTLLALASPSPERIKAIAGREAPMLRMPLPRIIYLDVAESLCFATIGGPLIILSRGFVEPLSDDDLTLVLRHELAHIRHRDPLRGIIVHLVCAALLVPGFEAIERALYLKRESQADHVGSKLSPEKYYSLLVRLSQVSSQDASICRGVSYGLASQRNGDSARSPISWTRFVPSGAAAALIVGVAASHAFFDEHLNYLLTHHC